MASYLLVMTMMRTEPWNNDLEGFLHLSKEAAQHGMNPTRAFGARLYHGFLALLVGFFRMVGLQTRRRRVMCPPLGG